MAEAKTKIQEVGERIKELLDETICILRRKPIKPYDAEIEYLESTGTQCIDTGISCGPNTYNTIRQLICEKPIHTTSGTWITTGMGTYSACWFTGMNGGNSTFWYGSGFANVNTNIAVGSDNYEDVFEYDLDFPQNKYVVKNLTKETTPVSLNSLTKRAPAKTNNLWIYGFSGDKGKHSGKVYYAKYWINRTLVRDFIPVRVGTVGYLYDKVSGELFGNAGTGSFVLGPDIVPIEYLESTGTQYVDTGIVPQDTTRIDCVYECIGTPPSDWWAVWGCEIYSGGWKNFHLRWQPTAGATHIHLRAGTSSVALGNEINVKNNTSLFWKSELSKCVHNGVEHVMTYSSVSMIPYSIYLFAQHDSSGATKKGKCRIYKLNIYGEDGLTRSFVPVRVGQVGYLLDKVSNKLYGNSGTGSFVLGPDTVPVIL